jgi:GNAT superfamily N-acetyltransferase
MKLSVATATEAEIPAIAALRTAVAEDLTRNFGRGHWSAAVTERAVAQSLRSARVLIALDDGRIVATLRLATKKPWAIDPRYFANVRRPLYLTDMAVLPQWQRRGIGRALVEEAKNAGSRWPADAIRLDAYDAPAGGGGFYVKCGFSEVGRDTYRGTPLIYFEHLF